MRAAKETGATGKSFVKGTTVGRHPKFGDDFEGVDSAAAGKGLRKFRSSEAFGLDVLMLKQKIYSKYEKLFTFYFYCKLRM